MRRFEAMIVGGVAVAVGLAAWLLSSRATSEDSLGAYRKQQADLSEKAQDVGRTLPVVALDESLTVERIAGLLAGGTYDDADLGLTPQQRDGLFTHAAELIHRKYVVKDAQAYREWMGRHGYRLRDREELEGLRAFSGYVYATGSALSPGTPLDLAFDTYWNAVRDKPRQNWNPVGLVSDERGWTVVTGVFTEQALAPTRISGKLSADFWRGIYNGSSVLWHRLGPDRSELVKGGRRIPQAQVGFVVKCANGDVVPTIATFCYVPDRGVWRLELFHRYNYPVDKLGPELF